MQAPLLAGLQILRGLLAELSTAPGAKTHSHLEEGVYGGASSARIRRCEERGECEEGLPMEGCWLPFRGGSAVDHVSADGAAGASTDSVGGVLKAGCHQVHVLAKRQNNGDASWSFEGKER